MLLRHDITYRQTSYESTDICMMDCSVDNTSIHIRDSPYLDNK
jgi:hypothetical protein